MLRLLRRETHLDQLTDELQEERVRRVIEPLLSGAVADPIPADGIRTFRKVRERNCYYVDKTAFIERLVASGTHYFLSRPPRPPAGRRCCLSHACGLWHTTAAGAIRASTVTRGGKTWDW